MSQNNSGPITSLNIVVEVGPCADCGADYRTTGLTPDAAGRPLCIFCHAHAGGTSLALPPPPWKDTPRPAKSWPGEPYMTQDEFIARYPTMRHQDLADLCHVSRECIRLWAKCLGIFTPRLQRNRRVRPRGTARGR